MEQGSRRWLSTVPPRKGQDRTREILSSIFGTNYRIRWCTVELWRVGAVLEMCWISCLCKGQWWMCVDGSHAGEDSHLSPWGAEQLWHCAGDGHAGASLSFSFGGWENEPPKWQTDSQNAGCSFRTVADFVTGFGGSPWPLDNERCQESKGLNVGSKPQKHFLVNNLHEAWEKKRSSLPRKVSVTLCQHWQGQSGSQGCGCSWVLAGPGFPASLAQPVPQRDLLMYDRGATCLSSEGIRVPWSARDVQGRGFNWNIKLKTLQITGTFSISDLLG